MNFTKPIAIILEGAILLLTVFNIIPPIFSVLLGLTLAGFLITLIPL